MERAIAAAAGLLALLALLEALGIGGRGEWLTCAKDDGWHLALAALLYAVASKAAVSAKRPPVAWGALSLYLVLRSSAPSVAWAYAAVLAVQRIVRASTRPAAGVVLLLVARVVPTHGACPASLGAFATLVATAVLTRRTDVAALPVVVLAARDAVAVVWPDVSRALAGVLTAVVVGGPLCVPLLYAPIRL